MSKRKGRKERRHAGNSRAVIENVRFSRWWWKKTRKVMKRWAGSWNPGSVFNKQLEAAEATADRWHFASSRQRCASVRPSIRPPGEAPWWRQCLWRRWRLAAVPHLAAGQCVYQLLISGLCDCCIATMSCATKQVNCFHWHTNLCLMYLFIRYVFAL